jgi:16S rRNA (cytosine1402-N4)-methyltransferase
MELNTQHIPVMVKEVEELLALKPGALVVDGTLGLGGHSLMMATAVGMGGRLIGIDQDETAILKAKERLKAVAARVDIVKSNFSRMNEVLDGLGIKEVDAFLFDVGVSSMQIDMSERGFSFREDGPLDMRMDPSEKISAFDLVNDLSEKELARILLEYGEERFSSRIASVIVRTRAARQIKTTKELADLISGAVPRGYDHARIHPATRSFQALRVAVNHELDALSTGIKQAFERLKKNGRMCVISFHSLEDRIVKDMFRELDREGRAKILTKKPLRPSDEEANANSRARSARLRALERIQ